MHKNKFIFYTRNISKLKFHLLFSFFIIIPSLLKAQIHCGTVEFIPNSPLTQDFTFDSFNQYLGGITFNNIGQLRINVEDKAIVDPDCRWFLTMEISNSGGGTPAGEWETLVVYGGGAATTPPIDLLQIRLRNGCQTSPIDGLFQTFTNHGDVTNIIADGLARNDAGNCNLNVNGPGDYLTNYNEYTFTIDVRIKPNFTLKPGIYQLSVKFHLEEQM